MILRLVTSRYLPQNLKGLSRALDFQNLYSSHYHHCRNLRIFDSLGERTFSTNPTENVSLKNNYGNYDTEKIFEEISQGNPEILKKCKLLELEITLLKEEECAMPETLKKKHWLELLGCKSVIRRKKYLNFLHLNELKKCNRKLKKKKRYEMLLLEREMLQEGSLIYGFYFQSMFLRNYNIGLRQMQEIRQSQADFNVIFDCSYQEYMGTLNTKACAKQISYCLSYPKVHPFPCKLEFFNLNRNDALGVTLNNYVSNFYENKMAEIHSGSYLDKYPKEKLVYLTPHATSNLSKVNLDDIYIIGAFIDKGTGEKVSLAKAKEQSLRMAKFPIDQFVKWKSGNKTLPLNVVLQILLDMARYNDWSIALRNLSKKKIDDV